MGVVRQLADQFPAARPKLENYIAPTGAFCFNGMINYIMCITMWKVIKITCILVLVARGITIPLSDTARPGSLVYSVVVAVNEPVWAWAHLTQAGRSEQLVLQLEKRYQDILKAQANGEQWQLQGALRAEAITFVRVRTELARATTVTQAKPAYTLVSQSLGIVRGYGQVFQTLATTRGSAVALGDVRLDAQFFTTRQTFLKEEEERLRALLAAGTDRQELVRGVDEQLRAMDGMVANAITAYSVAAHLVPSEYGDAFRTAIVDLQTKSAAAKLQASQDLYADAYMAAAQVQAEAYAFLSVLYGLSTYTIVAPPVFW